LHDGKIFDQPLQTVQRYVFGEQKSTFFGWRFNNKCRSMPQGKQLRLALTSPATVHWSIDGWQTSQDTGSRPTGLGIHAADLPTNELTGGREILFTFYWQQAQHWEGTNFSVVVENS
jgi:glucoamylase